MARILVFAYGSNLNERQMRARCPSAARVTRAVLPNHALVFAGYSARWGGAVASLARKRGARVHGLVYRVTRFDLLRLDGFEGYPFAYLRERKAVVTPRGKRLRVHTYFQPESAVRLVGPSLRYFERIWKAYGRLDFDRAPLMRAVLEDP
jgi:gamma-glutamylcyclotransferase (GGCT)/AIG2-like uncharacterized protein YtfP